MRYFEKYTDQGKETGRNKCISDINLQRQRGRLLLCNSNVLTDVKGIMEILDNGEGSQVRRTRERRL